MQFRFEVCVTFMNRVVTILLVEDDDAHAELERIALESGDHPARVERVADGDEALDYLRRAGTYADKPRPDLILLDLNMPRVDGHEVLTEIKADDELRTIPVVVLTTSASIFDKSKAYQHHANSYVVKPFDFRSFRRMLNDLRTYWSTWNEVPENIG
jgi:CheY-like chemotaxis protein